MQEERPPTHWTKIVEWTVFILFLLYVILLVVSVRATARREEFTPQDYANQEFGKFADLDGDHIYYELYRAKKETSEYVVFLHGLASSTKTWEHQIQFFQNEFNVLLLDLPGFGRSQELLTTDLNPDQQAIIINKLFRKLGIGKANIVGHSMGGGVAMRYALSYPERTGKLVLLSPVDLSGALNIHTLSWLNHPLLGQIPAGLIINHGLVNRMVELAYEDKSLITDDLIARYYEPLTIKGATVNLLNVLFAHNTDRTVETGTIDNEVLMLSGEDDKVIPPQMTTNLIKGLDHLTQYKLEGLGHILQEEDPVTINPIIMAFLLQKEEQK